MRITSSGAAEGAVFYEVMMTNAQGQTGFVRMDEKGADASKKQ